MPCGRMTFDLRAKLFALMWTIPFLASPATAGYLSASGCAALEHSGPVDEWALLEYQVGPLGVDTRALELEHSSSTEYGERLRECAVSGRADLPRDGFGHHTLFRYRPSGQLTHLSSGRHISFEPSEALRELLRGLDGNLALRLEFGYDDTLRGRELLFSSDSELGSRVLDTVDSSVEVQSRGPRGSYVDVLYLRFEGGHLVTFSQINYQTSNQLAGDF